MSVPAVTSSPPPIAPAPPRAPPPTATRAPEPRPAKTGVWIGIATISMSFAAVTSAMVARQGAAPDWRHFELPPILYLNTVILAASSFTLELARRRIGTWVGGLAGVAALAARALSWLYLTLGLGLLFVLGQLLAWRSLIAQGLFLATSPSSSFFYVFTALHSLHLLGGVAGLVYVLHRLNRVGARAMTALGAAAVYWHFMGVLWLYLLTLLALRV